jgi:hypothetical protein
MHSAFPIPNQFEFFPRFLSPRFGKRLTQGVSDDFGQSRACLQRAFLRPADQFVRQIDGSSHTLKHLSLCDVIASRDAHFPFSVGGKQKGRSSAKLLRPFFV